MTVTAREGTTRIEAFSDGVFAIAATLLVVDLKVPRGLANARQLIAALSNDWPTYVSYAASFIYLGIYWAHHHHVYGFYRRTDHIFIKLNIIFLMVVALLPFPTALLGTYLYGNPAMRRVVVIVYTGMLFVTAGLFLGIWLYASHRHRLIDHDLDVERIEATTRRYMVGPLGYAVALVLAFWWPGLSLVVTLVTTLFYLLPLHLVREDS